MTWQKNEGIIVKSKVRDRICLDWPKTCEFEGTDASSGSMMEHHFAPPPLSPPEYQTRFILIALFISPFSFALTPASLESTLTNGASDA